MSIKNYSLHFTNNVNMIFSVLADAVLYNKLYTQVGTSSSEVTLYQGGSFDDFKAVLGSDFFNLYFYCYAWSTPGGAAAELFSHFPHATFSDNYKFINETFESHGIFYNHTPSSCIYGYHMKDGGGYPAMFSYEQPWGPAYTDFEMTYFGVVDPTMWTSSRKYKIVIGFSRANDPNGVWTIRGAYMAPTWASALSTSALNFFNNYLPDPTNPFQPGGYSGIGGGDPVNQNWDEDSDTVGADNMPDETSVGAVACDLLTILSPTAAQMKILSKLLWCKDFFTYVANMVTNIQDLFISFGVVPFEITGKETVAITWFEFYTSATGSPPATYALLDKAPQQWYEFNMGSISLDGTDSRIFASDSVLDYSPYSKLGIYLPFIGYQELDIDECRGNTLTLTYRIDILSGACVALLDVEDRTIYQFSGNCLTQLPLTGEDTTSVIGNAVNVGIAMAGAGAAGAIASAGEALTAEKVAEGTMSAAGAELQNAQHAARVSSANGSLASATANAMMGMKPNYKKSGAISGATSLLAVKQPYLFLTTPRQSIPDGYERICGFPSNIGGKLGDFTGYTVVEDIRLNGLVATSPEVEEIYSLLKSGIII